MSYYTINAFDPHSAKKVKIYFVDWVEFYLLGEIIPRDYLPMWLSAGGPPIVDRENNKEPIKMSKILNNFDK